MEEARHRSSRGQCYPYSEAWWWQHHAVGRLVRIEGKMNAAMYRDILNENLLQSALDLWGDGSSFSRTTTLNTQPRYQSQEWLQHNSVNVLEWPSQSPDSNLIEHLCRDLKMAVHRCFPSNLMALERCCKEEWAKLPKDRSAKLVASYSKRLEAVIAAKGASTKYRAKAVNTYSGVKKCLPPS